MLSGISPDIGENTVFKELGKISFGLLGVRQSPVSRFWGSKSQIKNIIIYAFNYPCGFTEVAFHKNLASGVQ